jgi:RNA polymerase sigma factor (sigma-70 family)
MDLEETFRQYLPLIEKAATSACRKYGLSREDVEDFTQQVKLKVWDDDYAVLRKHKGLSSLGTYLAMVVRNALLDYVDHLWGKWRNSAEAKRLGPTAELLERLLVRDRLSHGEACQALRSQGQVEMSDAEIAALAARLPPCRPRRGSRPDAGGASDLAGDVVAASVAAPLARAGESADDRVVRADLERRRQKALAALAQALASLPDEERLIMKMLGDGLSYVQVARHLHIQEKPLYGRVDRIRRRLRQTILADGVSSKDIEDILYHADL